MSYRNFADVYDVLTKNVDHRHMAKYIHSFFQNHIHDNNILLDLACGTGSLSVPLAKLGYDVIGVDSSLEMLMTAGKKVRSAGENILFLHQDMTELDLYGTIGYAVCMLDSLNHLDSLDMVKQALSRVALFLEKDGLFLFDMNTPYKHKHVLGNNTFVLDTDDVFCVWQNAYTVSEHTVEMELDFFAKNGELYKRETSEITEKAYDMQTIIHACNEAGFNVLHTYKDYTHTAPSDECERITYIMQKG